LNHVAAKVLKLIITVMLQKTQILGSYAMLADKCLLF
jgi:hypothetical protein